MTNQELLEYAAKAAGLEINKTSTGTLFVRKGVSQWDEWNPLTDDGDALRLAVKLKMFVGPSDPIYIGNDEYAYGVDVEYVNEYGKIFSFIEKHGDDPYAATRRAIVRAAAEIGKEMTA